MASSGVLLRRQARSLRPWRRFTRVDRVAWSSTLANVEKESRRAHETTPESDEYPWRIASATVLERLPVVLPDPAPIEEQFNKYRINERNRTSVEMNTALFKPKPGYDDFNRGQLKRAATFTPAPRVTEADRINDTRSLDRALQKHLYFVIKRTPAAKFFQFPQRLTEEGGSMRESAEKALKAVIGVEHRVYFIGNAPMAHLVHTYSPELQKKNGVQGVKLFFYRAQLIEGEVDSIRQGVDFQWLSVDEIKQQCSPEYFHSVRRALW